jgi:hypothetical protein
MKVYTLRFDSNNYQRFLPEEEGIWKTGRLKLNCTRKLQEWVPPQIYVPNPTLKKGNFSHLCSGAFVTDSAATEELRDLLEMAGELLPLHYKNEDYALLNVTECMDCLDHDRTEWELGKTTGAKIRIIRHVFRPNRLPESSIFKIPERLATIYVAEGRFDPEDEFKSRVEKSQLQGLLFEEVWRDNGQNT